VGVFSSLISIFNSAAQRTKLSAVTCFQCFIEKNGVRHLAQFCRSSVRNIPVFDGRPSTEFPLQVQYIGLNDGRNDISGVASAWR